MSAQENKQKFIEWAYSTQAGPRQLVSIKTYANKLEDISSITGINIGCDFFDIDSKEQFYEVKNKIEAMPNYETWNRSYQHSIISASLGLFKKYIESTSGSAQSDYDLWPSLEEYNPNISKEQWLELLTEGFLLTENTYIALAAMFDIGGQATCAQLSKKYGRTSDFYRTTMGTQLATKILNRFNLPKCKDNDGTEKVWPVLFRGRNATKDEEGNYLWAMRPELFEALSDYGILKYLKYGTDKSDSWDIVDDNTVIKHCDKSFYEHNGSDIPIRIRPFFEVDNLQPENKKSVKLLYLGTEYEASIGNGKSNPGLIRLFWHADLKKLLNQYQTNQNMIATYRKLDESTYELTMSGDVQSMAEPNTYRPEDVKGYIKQIRDYIISCGFTYSEELISNFFLSLKSKPFVILAGTSGTGKTKLVKLFAEAIGAKYIPIPVKPDWSDSSDLFGHTDLNENFIPGPVCEAFEYANSHRNQPVFLCLDEMNLARVEYYLSDYLSVIETREWTEKGSIITKKFDKNKYSIPDNLFVIGTVNMDETTFPFSKKVLDRANTIEFNTVELIPNFDEAKMESEPLGLPNEFLRADYLVLTKDCADEQQEVQSICKKLEEINNVLKEANAHVGYRVRDEICFYMLNRKKYNLLTENSAFDFEIMQKILPRIQGSSKEIKEILTKLFKICSGNKDNFEDNGKVNEQMQQRITNNIPYKESAVKIAYMMMRFENDGFTSYWL